MSVEKTDWHKDERTWHLVKLLIECRDALPALSVAQIRMHNIPPDLCDRIDQAIEPWALPKGTEGGI